jgi:hypothetical protein
LDEISNEMEKRFMSRNWVIIAATTLTIVASAITPVMADGGHGGGHFYGPHYLVCTSCPKLHVSINPSINPSIVGSGLVSGASGAGGGSAPPANPRQPQKK